MRNYINIANIIRKDLDADWKTKLEEVNLHKTFESIFETDTSNKNHNIIIAAIIFSYDNNSQWIDLKQDGFEINKNIMIGLGADLDDAIIKDFIALKNENILDSIGCFLDLLPDWRFITIRKQIDYHSRYVRETETSFTDVDEDKKIKARENIGKLIKESITQRRLADELIKLIETDYVHTNHKVESDFKTSFTQKSIEFSDNQKVDVMSWRQFIKNRNERKNTLSN